jgi:hypothetical protein
VGEEDVRSEWWLGTTGRGIVLLRIEVVIRSFPHTLGKVRAAGILGSVVSVGARVPSDRDDQLGASCPSVVQQPLRRGRGRT